MKELLESKSQKELLERLGRYVCQAPLQIRVVVAGSLEPVAQIAEKNAPFPLRIQRINDFSVGQFNYGAGELRLHGTVFFCTSPHRHISYLISVCSGKVWHRSIVRLVHSLYPKLVPVFLSQQELLSLLRDARSIFPDSEFRVVGHTKKQPLKMGSRRKYESSRTRTEKPLEAVFTEAAEQNYWFSSLSFESRHVTDHGRQVLGLATSATISKYGHFFCTSQFERFLYGTLNRMADLAEQKMKFFSSRSRQPTQLSEQFSEPKPISITYDSPDFISQADTNNFVAIMRKMAGASCSVIHNNPYVHLSLVDSTDGSAAELWVLRNDEILLVPQLKSSEAALKKVVNYIFEEWREGSLSSSTFANELRP
jgi:hypothetical protein